MFSSEFHALHLFIFVLLHICIVFYQPITSQVSFISYETEFLKCACKLERKSANKRTTFRNQELVLVILFKKCRDATQIQHFLQQAFTTRGKTVHEAYKNAVATPRGYLALDFRPDT